MLSYLDAGTGGMIMAAFAAGFAGVVVLVRMYWNRLLGIVSPKHRARAKAHAAALTGADDTSD